MARGVDLCLPVIGPNGDSQSMNKKEHGSKRADVELAEDLLHKVRAFEKRGLAQRLYIAVFMPGDSARTSWMFEGAEEGFTVREPIDRWYRICKRMAEEGFFRAFPECKTAG